MTGGAGFVGSHLCDALLADGHEVICVDDLSTGRPETVARLKENGAFTFHEGPIEGPALEEAFAAKPDWVFHWAACVGVKRVFEQAQRVVDDALGIRRVLDLARKHDASRVLFSSSSEVYGNLDKMPLREDGPTNPEIPYAVTKLYGETALTVAHEEQGLNTTSLRFFNVYGPRQDGSAYGYVVAIFADRVHRGLPLQIYGDGTQTRDFTYVKDNVRSTLDVAAADNAGGMVINIGTGKATTVNDLAKAAIAAKGSGSIEYMGDRAYEVRERVAAVDRLRAVTGRVPETPLEEGLRATLEAM